MNHSTEVTAGVIIIGNEVLSGRTQDTNLAYMGGQLDALGIRIMESRVIPDIEQTIIDTVNHFRETYTYVALVQRMMTLHPLQSQKHFR